MHNTAGSLQPRGARRSIPHAVDSTARVTTMEPPMFADKVALTQAAGSPSYSRAVLRSFWEIGAPGGRQILPQLVPGSPETEPCEPRNGWARRIVSGTTG